MAVTKQQLIDLGFVPSKRGAGVYKNRKFDTLLFPIDDTDFIYIGYNSLTKRINNKVLWKSFKDQEGNRITYPIISLGETSYTELKDFLERAKASIVYKAIPLDVEEANASLAVSNTSTEGNYIEYMGLEGLESTYSKNDARKDN